MLIKTGKMRIKMGCWKRYDKAWLMNAEKNEYFVDLFYAMAVVLKPIFDSFIQIRHN
jgi:hypothetical protein